MSLHPPPPALSRLEPPSTSFQDPQPPLIAPSWSPLTTPTPIPTTHQPSGLCCGLLPCLVSLCRRDLAWGSRPDGRAVLEKWRVHCSHGVAGPPVRVSSGLGGWRRNLARVPGPPWCLCRVLTHPPRHPLHPPPHRPLCVPGTGLRSARPLAGWPRSATAHAHSLSPAHAPSPLGHPLFSDSASSVTAEAPWGDLAGRVASSAMH